MVNKKNTLTSPPVGTQVLADIHVTDLYGLGRMELPYMNVALLDRLYRLPSAEVVGPVSPLHNPTIVIRGSQAHPRQRPDHAVIRATQAFKHYVVLCCNSSRFLLIDELTLTSFCEIDNLWFNMSCDTQSWIAAVNEVILHELT